MALTTCNECEGEVSTNAQACPHCGAPTPATAFQRAMRKPKGAGLVGCIGKGILFGFAFLVVCSVVFTETDEEKATKERIRRSELQAAVQVPFDQLTGDYNENELRADNQYGGRYVRTRGRVFRISKNMIDGAGYLMLGDGLLSTSVRCNLNERGLANAMSIKEGDTVTVVGKSNGLTVMAISLTDCEVVK